MRRRALDLPARHLLSAAAVVRASTARPRARRLGQDPRARRCPAPPGPESVSEADPRRTRLMLRTRASATDLCTRLVERIRGLGRDVHLRPFAQLINIGALKCTGSEETPCSAPSSPSRSQDATTTA